MVKIIHHPLIYVMIFLFSVASLQGYEANQFSVVLEGEGEAVLSAEVQSTVKKIAKKLGDSFKKGDILIELDDLVYKANYMKAMAILEKTRSLIESKKELYQDEIISEYEYKEAVAENSAAEAEVIIQREKLDATKITAPFDGKVEMVNVKEHELVTPGIELIKIVDDHTLVAKMLISSRLHTHLSLGGNIYINLKDNGEEVIGKITRIGAVIDPSSSTIRVEAEIDNSDGKLKSGMIGRASLQPFKINSENGVKRK